MLQPAARGPMMERMMAATAVGGYNVMRVFTNTIPEPEDQRGLMVGLFEEGELFDVYRDWEILKRNSEVFSHTHPGGISHEHAKNEVVARKR